MDKASESTGTLNTKLFRKCPEPSDIFFFITSIIQVTPAHIRRYPSNEQQKEYDERSLKLENNGDKQ